MYGANSCIFFILSGVRVVRRNHDAVLTECHTLLLDIYRRVGCDWKKVVQNLKSASLSHEGDEEAKQDQMLMGHSRRMHVKAKVASQSQASLAAAPAAAQSSGDSNVFASQPTLLHGDTFQQDDDMGEDTAPAAAPTTTKDDTSHAPWHVYLAQNLGKV